MDDAGTVHDVRALHAAHAAHLHAFALRATGDRGAADEIVQDTLLRAWRAADRYDPERGDVRTWLFTIARNLVVDHHRRRGARPVVPVDGDGLDGPGGDGIDIDRAVERWQVAEALARLSPAHRDAIVEIHLRASSVAEAAERLGVPAGTVKSRVYYGLRALRLELEEMGVVR